MKVPIKFLGGIGGLSSAILTIYIEVISFLFAGIVFAALIIPSILIWKQRVRQSVSVAWSGIAALMGICVAAPFLCFLLVAAVSWISPRSPERVITPLAIPGASPTFVIGVAAAWAGWAGLLAASLRIITGDWDNRFVAQLLIAGIVVLVFAFGADFLAHHKDRVFDNALYLAGQSVSGFLIGASLDRRTRFASHSVVESMGN